MIQMLIVTNILLVSQGITGTVIPNEPDCSLLKHGNMSNFTRGILFLKRILFPQKEVQNKQRNS
jgi:hypothetical protein